MKNNLAAYFKKQPYLSIQRYFKAGLDKIDLTTVKEFIHESDRPYELIEGLAFHLRLNCTLNYKGEITRYELSEDKNTFIVTTPYTTTTYKLKNNELISSIDSNGDTQTWEYNEKGLIIKQTDITGLVIDFKYDENNNRIEMFFSDDIRPFRFEYNKNNNLVKEFYPMEPNDLEIDYIYNDKMQLIEEITGTRYLDKKYSYDDRGNLIKAVNGYGTVYYWEYNDDNQVIGVLDMGEDIRFKLVFKRE